METKKFKIKKPEVANGDRKITKTSKLSNAMFTLMGGIVGAGAAFAANTGTQTSEDSEKNKPTNNHGADSVKEPTNEPLDPVSATDSQQSEDITEPQPIDSNQASYQPSDDTNEEEIDPDEVAQALVHEIDEDDIDGKNQFWHTPSFCSNCQKYLKTKNWQFNINPATSDRL